MQRQVLASLRMKMDRFRMVQLHIGITHWANEPLIFMEVSETSFHIKTSGLVFLGSLRDNPILATSCLTNSAIAYLTDMPSLGTGGKMQAIRRPYLRYLQPTGVIQATMVNQVAISLPSHISG